MSKNQPHFRNGSSGERIEDWFDSGEQFEEALDSAEDNAEAKDDSTSTDFLERLRKTWDDHGMRAFLSGSQHKWLMDLADL